jgi:hypothetical protein
MDYMIPAGRFSGRRLGSLSPDERAVLRRTRTPALAHARELLPGLDLVHPGPVPEPEAILPLALVPRRRPLQSSPAARWPPKVPTPWPAPWFRVPQVLRWLAMTIVILLMHPPLARVPGMMIGFIARALALRAREVATHFLGSIVDQLGDLTSDTLEWLDSWFSFVPSETGKPAPGQKIVTFMCGLLALRSISQWR